MTPIGTHPVTYPVAAPVASGCAALWAPTNHAPSEFAARNVHAVRGLL